MIGGYRVIRKVAAGGFGVVYLALDSEGQKVAVKEYLPSSLATRAPGELRPQVASEKLSLYRLGLKSFFEEGRSLAQISHPSVVSVMNFFRENETVYMVMNYLEGAALQDFIITARDLKQQKVFRESTIRSLFDEILRGLRIVHQHKMLHLDIKPENILRRSDGASVLSDFGIARAAEIKLGLTGEGTSIGTPHYMSPEQWRGEVVDGRADLYGLGVVLFQLLSGKLPYDGANGWTVGMQHMNAPIPSLPPALQYLQRLVDDLLAKDPAARPQTGFEVIQRIDAHLSGGGMAVLTSHQELPLAGRVAHLRLD